jgi:amino-acid N-acetyltransferase
MLVRSAVLPDARHIERLVAAEVTNSSLIPRSFPEICENIRDFMVVEDKGKVVGCGALHLYGMHLAEIRSITVRKPYRNKGAGRVLIDALMAEAERQHVTCICLFTKIPDFFGRLGFRTVDRQSLPDKAYKDCQYCPKLHACDEVPMVRGELPNFAILAPHDNVGAPSFPQQRPGFRILN